MGPLAVLGLGAAAGAAQGAFGLYGAAKQQEYYKENQERAAAMQQNEELLRASRNVQGMKMAGLSPALAADGKFSPGSAPSSPLGSMPSVDFAQAALAMAESHKADAEAKSIQIDNANKEDANATASLNLTNWFRTQKEQAIARGDNEAAAFYSQMEGEAGSVGALESLHKFFSLADDAKLYDLHMSEYELQKKVVDFQKVNGIFKDIAKAPRTERLQMIKLMHKMEYEIENLKADTQGKFMDVQLTEEQKKQIELISKHYKNSDLASMVAEGRYKDAAKYILANALAAGAEHAVEAAEDGAAAVVTKKVPVKVQHVK